MLSRSPRAQIGMNLIELMVGMTVGLIVIAGATNFFVNYLASNRDMLSMASLDQEMRATMDLMVRDLRRAGYKQEVHQDILNLDPTTATRAAVMPVLDDAEAMIFGTDQIEFWYDENDDNTVDTASTSEKHGFRLRGGEVQRFNGAAGNWEAVTDATRTEVTALDFTRTYRCIDIDGPTGPATCGADPASSDDGAYFVTEVAVAMSGRLVQDRAISRTLNERVRIRADIYRDPPTGVFTY